MKITFFSPHAAVWAHSYQEALVAEALKDLGEVTYLTCNRLFSEHCIAMSGMGLGQDATVAEKETVCRRCRANTGILRKSFHLPGNDINAFIDDDDKKQIEIWLGEVVRGKIEEFEIEGIPVGRLCLYETLLHSKKLSLEFNDQEWRKCLVALRNCLLTFVAAKKFLETESPDCVLTFNTLYSVNAVFCAVAKSKGVKTYFLSLGSNIAYMNTSVYLAAENTWHFYAQLKSHWKDFENIPCSKRELSRISDHFIALFNARSVFVYSSPSSTKKENIRKVFGIQTDQKLLVATLSSVDEIFAAETVGVLAPAVSSLFKVQSDWIEFLIREASKRPEWFLLIRVHPREFPNKREDVISEQAAHWRRLLNNLPKNIRVNWPEDNISLYDIAGEMDLCLNAWSSAGKEMALLGIPVIVYSEELLCYAPEINELARSEKEYLSLIEKLLASGWSIERAIKAFRWHVLEFERTCNDISDGVRHKQDWEVGKLHLFLRKVLNKTYGKLDPYFREKLSCTLRSKKIRASNQLVRIIGTKANSPLDFPETYLSNANLDHEARYIREELARINQRLNGLNSRQENKLSKNILATR